MSDKIRQKLGDFPNIARMMKGIPKSLWYIFVPEDENELAMLESDILAQRKRDEERKKVMAIQKLCGFPLRPNQALKEVIALAKSKGMREDELPLDFKRDNPNSR